MVYETVRVGKVENGTWPKDKLFAMLNAALQKDNDRALFELPPLKQDSAQTKG